MDMPGERREKHNKGYRAVLITSKTIVKILVVILFVFVIIFLAKWAYSLGYETAGYTAATSEEAADVTVQITADMSVRDIGNLLIEEGILDESLNAFLFQEKFSDYHDCEVPGEYVLNPRMGVEEILKIISGAQDGEE